MGPAAPHQGATSPSPGSFAALLLAARDPATGRPLPDRLMFPEIAALFFAGIDTTGHTGVHRLLGCMRSTVLLIWRTAGAERKMWLACMASGSRE